MIIDRTVAGLGPRCLSILQTFLQSTSHFFFSIAQVPDTPGSHMYLLFVSRWILHQIKLLRRLLYPAESCTCHIVLVVC